MFYHYGIILVFPVFVPVLWEVCTSLRVCEWVSEWVSAECFTWLATSDSMNLLSLWDHSLGWRLVWSIWRFGHEPACRFVLSSLTFCITRWPTMCHLPQFPHMAGVFPEAMKLFTCPRWISHRQGIEPRPPAPKARVETITLRLHFSLNVEWHASAPRLGSLEQL